MVYHSVTVPFSQYRISNSNTDIDDFFNTGELKKKTATKQINVFLQIILLVEYLMY